MTTGRVTTDREPTRRAPLVSVCIPAFNASATIGQTIESVLGQTFRDFELVVFDNHSDDGTPDVVRRYSDPRVRLVVNDSNVGAAGNWNKALAAATGRYFKLLCADDLLEPDCLRRQVDALEDPRNAGAVLASSARRVVDPAGRHLLVRRYPGPAGLVSGRECIRACVVRGTNVIGEGAAVLLRADVAQQVGGFEAAAGYCIDLVFWSRVLARGDAFVMHDPLCSFRVLPQSWSVAARRTQARSFMAVMELVEREGIVTLTALERARGWAMAHVNRYLRMLVYRLVASRPVAGAGETSP